MPVTVHALLVGIDAYPHPEHRLSGCRNDAVALQELLTLRIPAGQLFLEKLLDEQATRARVIERFRAHLGQAGPGDTALFFFAGHGSRERAPEAFWAIEPDRLDETLVLWDSREPGGWDLADKELASLIRQLAAAGPHVVVILDCCHSGSGTRDIGRVRNVTVRRAPVDGRERPLESFLPEVQAAAGAATQRGESGWSFGDGGQHILLAACRDDQEAAEYSVGGEQYGAFSHCLIDALRETPGTVTYRDLAAIVRARVIAALSDQTPQVEATLDADLDRAFLEGALQPRAQGFVVAEDAGEWRMDGGLIHGVPPPAGGEHAAVALFTATATAADMSSAKNAVAFAELDVVEAVRSRVSVTQGQLTHGQTYKAAIVALPVPSRRVRVSGSEAEANAAREALGHGVFVVESDGEAEFHLVCAEGSFDIRRAAEEHPLTAPAASAAEAVETLEHIARWQHFAGLENPVTAISADEFEVALIDGRQGNVELPGSDVRLTATRNAQGKLVAPEFRVRLTNRGTRDLYFGLLALDEMFSCSSDLLVGGVLKLAPSQVGWALDGKPLKSAIPQALRDQRRTESRDILKVIVSTTDFEIRHAAMRALGVARRAATGKKPRSVLERILARGQSRTISAASDDDAIKDFCTRTIIVTTVEPRPGVAVSATGAADLGAGVRIEAHSALQATARLTTVTATRGDVGAAILPPLFRGDGVSQTVRFTSSRGGDPPLSVLELNGVSDYEAVTAESPLTVALPLPAAAPGELVLPVGYDGEDYLILGHGVAGEAGTRVRLVRLPHPIGNRKRSLTGSIKIVFQKFVSSVSGAAYNYPLLAEARWDDGGKARYDHEIADLRERVAKAKRVVIFVHGIIGDTLMMGSRLTRGLDDVFLAFDYENLHTTIEENAAKLKERLLDVGLDEGHGKEVIIVAHSMGGLVSRWFAEKLDGRKLVSHIILCGTPNAGSNWATIEDWVTATASLALNQLTKVSWSAAGIAALFAGVEKIDNALDEMRPGSTFLKALDALDDPFISYVVLAGNTSLAAAADRARVKRLLKKVLYRTMSVAFLFEPNDIAVTVKSIGSFGRIWKKPPETRQVACDHMSYFSSEAGLKELRALLDADPHP